jgi:hypothetical protein
MNGFAVPGNMATPLSHLWRVANRHLGQLIAHDLRVNFVVARVAANYRMVIQVP